MERQAEQEEHAEVRAVGGYAGRCQEGELLCL